MAYFDPATMEEVTGDEGLRRQQEDAAKAAARYGDNPWAIPTELLSTGKATPQLFTTDTSGKQVITEQVKAYLSGEPWENPAAALLVTKTEPALSTITPAINDPLNVTGILTPVSSQLVQKDISSEKPATQGVAKTAFSEPLSITNIVNPAFESGIAPTESTETKWTPETILDAILRKSQPETQVVQAGFDMSTLIKPLLIIGGIVIVAKVLS